MHLVDEEDMTIVQLAGLWEGHGVMPESGGSIEQAALTMASIRIVTTAWAQLRAAQRRKGTKDGGER